MERRKRQRLRAALLDLSDRELMDIGTTRGEIDYVASHRSVDPRGIRSRSNESLMFGTTNASRQARRPSAVRSSRGCRRNA
ncbi:DUF1127 domain-containing protein [Bradyrhizobium huanghuaihaiense]|uniref:DUF1127 domain-containing protein n=1 Tax=Bradyrhizobium huanghuaihaiense TaxID=990078 RepID=UPI0021AA4E09|nr:DUF1127 domain-containing protein [Bradyrhizobium sp. CB3035]UWU81375.1 DUF1127 domain-containing protein [Bradyrhizobium sp. CB3035]